MRYQSTANPAERPRSERGQAILLLAATLPALAMAAGLAIDVARAHTARSALQQATDAAALAAARAAWDPAPTEAKLRASAVEVAARTTIPGIQGTGATGAGVTIGSNPSNAPTGNVVLGRYDFDTRVFTPATTPISIAQVTAVRVSARISTVAGVLSATLGRLSGVESFDASTVSIAALGAPSVRTIDFPIVVDPSFFANVPKSLNPPVAITLSTSSTAVMWTGFLGGANASSVKSYIDQPANIPRVRKGDGISLTNGTMASCYSAAATHYPPGTVVTVAVAPTSGPSAGRVQGYAAFQVDQIVSTGSNKRIEGHLVSMGSTGLAPGTEASAECFGLNCRSLLVQ